jgi:hypothetical protein
MKINYTKRACPAPLALKNTKKVGYSSMSRDRLLNTQIVVLSNLNEIAIKRLFSHQAIQQSCIKITYSNINP